jgi:hypothetical protein
MRACLAHSAAVVTATTCKQGGYGDVNGEVGDERICVFNGLARLATLFSAVVLGDGSSPFGMDEYAGTRGFRLPLERRTERAQSTVGSHPRRTARSLGDSYRSASRSVAVTTKEKRCPASIPTKHRARRTSPQSPLKSPSSPLLTRRLPGCATMGGRTEAAAHRCHAVDVTHTLGS